MKQIILIAMIYAGSCFAGDFGRGPLLRPPHQLPELLGMVAVMNVVAGNPMPVPEEQKKPQFQKNTAHNLTHVPKNQKYPKSNFHQHKHR